METGSTVQFIPHVEEKLLGSMRRPERWLLNSVHESVGRLNELLNRIPSSYGWNYMTAEAFKEVVAALPSDNVSVSAFELYWKDALRQIEAYSVLNAYRITELAQATVWAINRRDVLCAAIMSRSALETTASYAWFQTEFRQLLSEMAAKKEPFPRDLEAKLLKVIFASKQGEDIYNPTNIVTIIQKIAKKIPHQDVILPIYNTLCEIAHPNRLGRSIYVASTWPTEVVGCQVLTITREHGPVADEILYNAISALSWASGGFAASFIVLQSCIVEIQKRVNDSIASKRSE